MKSNSKRYQSDTQWSRQIYITFVILTQKNKPETITKDTVDNDIDWTAQDEHQVTDRNRAHQYHRRTEIVATPIDFWNHSTFKDSKGDPAKKKGMKEVLS